MKRDTSMKNNIEMEWNEKINAEPELAGKRGAFLNYFTMRIGQMYEAEGPDVKAQVEVFREEEHRKNLASSETPPLLLAHEKGLPEAEKMHLLEVRTIQRFVQTITSGLMLDSSDLPQQCS